MGPWADELRAAWHGFAFPPPEHPVTLDLRDVTYVDASGMEILRQIYREQKPAFLTGSPLTESFAEQAQRSTPDTIEEKD